ncbi:aspartate kinase, partial [Candidatus Gottesmanbacteria bacterium]|nr:aspartate kinase [Candidatus Gottesmanbacteria bacterium]
MIVMKFGGASLSNSEGIIKACRIIKKYSAKHKIVLVVSAMKGVTNQLYQIVDLLKRKQLGRSLKILKEIKFCHFQALSVIKSSAQKVKVESELVNITSRLENFIKNVVQKEITPARCDFIVAFGERLSCPIIASALESFGLLAYPIDASLIIATNHTFSNAVPLYKKSQRHINKILFPLIKNSVIPVITGFIGFSKDGCTTTLGRGGSDLTASYLANLLDAKALYLWKDVDGFYTNDPHKDKDARLMPYLTYRQAEKMAEDGAKIIYYKAIRPVEKKHIPIYIKSFLKPSLQGTIVS